MAEQSYFFDSPGAGVNVYNTTQVVDWLYQSLGRPAGVLGGRDNSLTPATVLGLTSVYDTGVVTFQGRIYKNTTSKTMTHVAPTNGYRRIDAVVVRFDNSGTLSANLTVIQGVEKNDGSQVAPGLGAFDVSVSLVLIDNSTGLNTTTVTDARPLITQGSVLALSTSPYTLRSDAQGPSTFAITTGAGAFTFNLPTAASMIGRTVTIIKADAGIGTVNVVPNGTDALGASGNVPLTIAGQRAFITLTAIAINQWILVDTYVSTDGTLAAGSDIQLVSQKAVATFNQSGHGRLVYGPGAGTYTWTAPAGITKLIVNAVAQGGAGASGVINTRGGGGGGCGAWCRDLVLTVVPGAVYAITLSTTGATSIVGTGVNLQLGKGGDGSGVTGGAGGIGSGGGQTGGAGGNSFSATISYGGGGGGTGGAGFSTPSGNAGAGGGTASPAVSSTAAGASGGGAFGGFIGGSGGSGGGTGAYSGLQGGIGGGGAGATNNAAVYAGQSSVAGGGGGGGSCNVTALAAPGAGGPPFMVIEW